MKATLGDLGFLELLGIAETQHISANKRQNSKIQRFVSGSLVVAKDAEALRDALWKLAHHMRVSPRTEKEIYDGLCEAMTNTKDHAYTFAEDPPVPVLTGQWWMTGKASGDGKSLEIVFFDQGISIPASLPKSNLWEILREKFYKINPETMSDDANMIAAAVESERTSTAKSYHGKGLPQIKHVIKNAPAGQLRILSRRGKYVYSKRGGMESVLTGVLKEDIGGTLIHWELNMG